MTDASNAGEAEAPTIEDFALAGGAAADGPRGATAAAAGPSKSSSSTEITVSNQTTESI